MTDNRPTDHAMARCVAKGRITYTAKAILL